MIYKPRNFELYELLPRKFYIDNSYQGDRLWFMFDGRMLWTQQRLREYYGCKFVMNTWWWGGKHQYRGWRPWKCKVGAMLSQHKFARAGDSVPLEVSADEIRNDILTKDREEFQYITCIEMDVDWLHFDVRNHQKDKFGILKVYP